MTTTRSSCLRAALIGLGVLAAPSAFAIQEVTLGPKAPSFAASGLGWGMGPAMSGYATSPAAGGAFSPGFGLSSFSSPGGEPLKAGAFQFSTRSGPAWAMEEGAGFGAFGVGFPGSIGRGGFGFSTRSTASVMATDALMFYSSVGQTTFDTRASLVPTPPGLALLETPSARTDLRAGFRFEVMPGVSFGMEAGVSAPSR
jgi:hypothetical protein